MAAINGLLFMERSLVAGVTHIALQYLISDSEFRNLTNLLLSTVLLVSALYFCIIWRVMAAIHWLSSTKHSFEACLDYVLSVTLYSGLAISGM